MPFNSNASDSSDVPRQPKAPAVLDRPGPSLVGLALTLFSVLCGAQSGAVTGYNSMRA